MTHSNAWANGELLRETQEIRAEAGAPGASSGDRRDVGAGDFRSEGARDQSASGERGQSEFGVADEAATRECPGGDCAGVGTDSADHPDGDYGAAVEEERRCYHAWRRAAFQLAYFLDFDAAETALEACVWIEWRAKHEQANAERWQERWQRRRLAGLCESAQPYPAGERDAGSEADRRDAPGR